MRTAREATPDPKDLVRSGYDRCAGAYAARRRQDDSDLLTPLLDRLADGCQILDLGCGAGVPVTRALAKRHAVTGVDISPGMLRLAEAAVPGARFVCSDIAEVRFPEDSFDAVVAIFVLFHLPREEHPELLRSIWTWLRPGGYFLATLTESGEPPRIEEDFFGVPMYWSSLGWSDYEGVLERLGFTIHGGRIIGRGYGRTRTDRDERHPLVLAQKGRR